MLVQRTIAEKTAITVITLAFCRHANYVIFPIGRRPWHHAGGKQQGQTNQTKKETCSGPMAGDLCSQRMELHQC